MHTKIKIYLSFFLSAVLLLLTAGSVSALSLNPPTFDLVVEKGQKLETAVTIFNETEASLELFPETANFTVPGETGQPLFDFQDNGSGLASWFEAPKISMILEAKERKEIPVTINIPADAESGTHYAALFFGNKASAVEENPGASLNINSKLGSVFMVRVGGDITEAGSLLEFNTASGKKIFNRLPVDFMARFQNSGNVHLKPLGKIIITNIFNKKTAELNVNSQKLAALPGVIRKYNTVWGNNTTLAKKGFLNFWRETKLEWNNFAFGRYKAVINLNYGSANTSVSKTMVIWIIPWHLIVIVLKALTFLAIALIIGISRYNAWVIKKAGI